MSSINEYGELSKESGLISKFYYEVSGVADKTIQKINIPIGVKEIGESAFSRCELLEEVTIPNTVTTIRENAFLGCSKLKSINIPDSVTYLGSGVFAGCSSLEKVTISENITSISNGLFANCTSLNNVKIPNTVTKIYDTAFYNCESLNDITIPHSVNMIDRTAFEGCPFAKIGEVSYRNGTAFYTDSTFSTLIFSGSTEINYVKNTEQTLKRVIIMKGMRELSLDSFYGLKGLEEVILPFTITRIGCSVFEDCEDLQRITLPDFLERIGHCAFKNCKSLKTAILPDGVTDIEFDAFLNCTSLENIVLPKTVNSIGNNAFMNTKIKSITLPNSLKEVGKGIFKDCNELTELNLPNNVGVLNLNNDVISEQKSLGDVFKINISEGAKELESFTFNDANNLIFVELPKSLTKYGYACFNGCDSILTVKYSGDITSWCDNEFKMDIPLIINKFNTPMVANPLYFAKKFYADGKLVDKLNIPDSVTKINDYAFCRAPISDVNISGNVKSIGIHAFSSCDIGKVTFQSGLEKLSSYAFANCEKITSIVLPDTVTQIGDRCFSGCKNLESFAFNGALTFKSYSLLNDCEKLKKVFVKNKETLKNIYDDTTAEVFFYSENKPNEQGNFWHFVDNVPTIW